MAAARIGDSATVRDLLSGRRARRPRALGGDHNHYWTCFGPTNVQLHRAAAAVELGEGGRAVETHERIDPDGVRARCCRSGGPTTTSTSPAATRRSATSSRASEMLLEGDRLAPSEIRCRPLAHEVLSDVLRRTRGTPPAPIAELAEQMGVGV